MPAVGHSQPSSPPSPASFAGDVSSASSVWSTPVLLWRVHVPNLQSGAGGQGWPRILPGLELTSPSPQVQQYRVAMTAKDCSVMIALSPCLQDAR